MIDLKDKKFCIFGLQGSGKSVLAKHFYKKFSRPMWFAVHAHDVADMKKGVFWIPERDKEGFLKDAKGECREFIKRGIMLGKAKKINALFIDEADLFFQRNYDLDEMMQDLVLNHRHYGLAVCFISRRPQDIPTRIVESSAATFVFAVEGDNVRQKFRRIHPKLAELVDTLEHQDYHFIVKPIGKEPFKHKPIKP